MTLTHDILIERLRQWAKDDDNILALIATGSSSRAGGETDRFSDRDIEIIARDRAPLIADDAWIHRLGPVWSSLYLANDDDTHTRLVFFEGARKIDFSLNERNRIDAQVTSGLNELYDSGYRVLLDKEGITTGLPEPSGARPGATPPTQELFTATVGEFWFEATHMPTYLSRDDLWVVKMRHWTMTEMLLRMLEWHALIVTGPDTRTLYIGTKMKQWLDAETWREVHGVFGRFDRADAWRAIGATVALFTRLTHEVGQHYGLTWPRDTETAITAYLQEFDAAFRE